MQTPYKHTLEQTLSKHCKQTVKELVRVEVV